jgi:hypothetical protein
MEGERETERKKERDGGRGKEGEREHMLRVSKAKGV